ncbi:hypothetical protein IGI04_021251 [Brassica rapa subsp. trilocularis]|uniref:RST domain-containing protein n=1 Tax=Brassica rapa subsp. trilocularis TaxID=1813537 RepID=A0ABQ7ML33_BRACM|nr:hypothetical protein IGI04_021251 [Brassica rapa subsp. trilocularis]
MKLLQSLVGKELPAYEEALKKKLIDELMSSGSISVVSRSSGTKKITRLLCQVVSRASKCNVSRV